MTKLKVGDKVRIANSYYADGFSMGPGSEHVGKIIKVNSVDALVEFPGWTKGHDGRGLGAEQLTKRDCWYVPIDDLQIVPEAAKLHPSDTVILKHLRKRGSISPMEALTSYGCARLAPRIFNLRKAGYDIITKLCSDEPGHRYARYTLTAH